MVTPELESGGRTIQIGLLTGGSDKPYALGLTSSLSAQGVAVDFIGSDELDCPEVRTLERVRFLNLRGDQREDVEFYSKTRRIVAYYARLIRYAATTQAPLLHILWNNKFTLFDRTILTAYYRLVNKRVVLTAHNVNTAKRDGSDTWLNRISLRMQYSLCDHIFVHTARMKAEMLSDFGVPENRVSVIPFGINNTSPTTDMTRRQARQCLGVSEHDRTLLCFGQIAPYKGLEYLIDALVSLERSGDSVRVVIAGKIKKGSADYWAGIQQAIAAGGVSERVVQRIQFIPDEQVEMFFKAADAIIIPYVDIFQSGVPFLAYHFGAPVIATDVGSLRDDVIEGRTGFLAKPRDAEDLAAAIRRYFASDLYGRLETHRPEIRRLAYARHSWTTVSEITKSVYERLTTDRHRSR